MHQDFIFRAQDLLKDKVKEADQHRSENRWSKKNPEGHKAARKRYEKTALGKGSVSLRLFKRRQRMEIASDDLSYEERKAIGEFYLKCPSGYEVDHIKPIAKGGLHRLDNLQYLTASENRKKSAKTIEDAFEEISSNQMLQLNEKELRIFLPMLLKRMCERLYILPWIERARAPSPISCANVKLAMRKLKSI